MRKPEIFWWLPTEISTSILNCGCFPNMGVQFRMTLWRLDQFLFIQSLALKIVTCYKCNQYPKHHKWFKNFQLCTLFDFICIIHWKRLRLDTVPPERKILLTSHVVENMYGSFTEHFWQILDQKEIYHVLLLEITESRKNETIQSVILFWLEIFDYWSEGKPWYNIRSW